jgi:hypothetical protein
VSANNTIFIPCRRKNQGFFTAEQQNFRTAEQQKAERQRAADDSNNRGSKVPQNKKVRN